MKYNELDTVALAKTQALLTLSVEDVRPAQDSDLLSVRDISVSG